MKEWSREFDTSQQDTCQNHWNFKLQKHKGEAPVIQSLQIDKSVQGCPGHPKTISALVRNRSIDQIDLEALAATDCPRNQSCGQVLGECVATIAEDQ